MERGLPVSTEYGPQAAMDIWWKDTREGFWTAMLHGLALGSLASLEGHRSSLHTRTSWIHRQQETISFPCVFISLSAHKLGCFGTYFGNLWHRVLSLKLKKRKMSSFYCQRIFLRRSRGLHISAKGLVPQEYPQHCPPWKLITVQSGF